MNPGPQIPRNREQRLAQARIRFARLMKAAAAASLLVTALAFIVFRLTGTPTPLPFIGAVIFAIIGSLMLTAALMGLAFFSSASGADEDANNSDT
ncbi:hypothetical protein FJQ54_10565 [Sandaracinobacter neustonicus]|uniref:Uncharacterized protein n=1 Tax=Sandaracinobacter neustonicus TaxID=1715348 RepID=A0A501XII4_9SPHN|nr:hypothetical protein [Sandaracinobacter neustonicus]TPE60451.1 hypothetical protein FJQ54_10565 [Sandaracinobacter neustonicus]